MSTINQEKVGQFKAAVKGLHPWRVAHGMTTLTPGIDWRGSGIKHMAEEWATEPLFYHQLSFPIESLIKVLKKQNPKWAEGK